MRIVITCILLRKHRFGISDDVVVSLQDNDSTTIIEIHSESRIGWGDLGVNPEELRKSTVHHRH